eukprot:3118592-Rhodomonas_salina.1
MESTKRVQLSKSCLFLVSLHLLLKRRAPRTGAFASRFSTRPGPGQLPKLSSAVQISSAHITVPSPTAGAACRTHNEEIFVRFLTTARTFWLRTGFLRTNPGLERTPSGVAVVPQATTDFVNRSLVQALCALGPVTTRAVVRQYMLQGTFTSREQTINRRGRRNPASSITPKAAMNGTTTMAETPASWSTPAVIFNLTDDITNYIEMRMNESDAAWSMMLEENYNATTEANAGNSRDMDIAWLITCGAL